MTKRKEKENNRNKRILLALLMLFVTGIALTTATYAWFSANTAVKTTGINVKVTASTGIALSADAKNFAKTVTWAQIYDFAKDDTDAFDSTLQFPEMLSPVSTAGFKSGADFQFYTGTLGGDADSNNYVVYLQSSNKSTTLGSEAADGNRYTSGDFLSFDLYFRSSTAQTIKLNSDTIFTQSGTNYAYLNTAARIGFLPLGTTDDSNDATQQASAYALNGGETTNWSIYNPYPTQHHANSISYGYGDSDTESTSGYYAAVAGTGSLPDGYDKDGGTSGAERKFFKFLYKDIKALGETPAYLELISSTNSHYLQGTADSIVPTGNVFRIGAGITKVRVYVWLEGNDIDCVDAISISDGMTINLGFEVA